MPNAPGNIDNSHLPSKLPIHPRNPPVAVSGDSAACRNNKDLPIEPLSVLIANYRMLYDVGTRHVVSAGAFVGAGSVHHAQRPW